LFLGFGYQVNVCFNFRSWQMQAGMQVSLAILFRVSLFNHCMNEKALSQIMNMGRTSSVQSLWSGGNCQVSPWFQAWLPFYYFKFAYL